MGGFQIPRIGRLNKGLRHSSSLTPIDYCGNQLRSHDYQGYLCSLFIPSSDRHRVWALGALNVELAQVQDVVTNPSIGRIRLAWWREAIDQIWASGAPVSHPVAQALSVAKTDRNLSKNWITRLVVEREKRLVESQPLSLADLETYAEHTASTLLYLNLQAIGASDVHSDHAASHIGKAMGIATALQATPFQIRERRLSLPAEIMAKYRISSESVFRHGPSKELSDAVFEIATKANDHLITARSFMDKVPPSSFPALLPAVACADYLDRLQKANFNIFEPSLFKRNWKLPFKLWNQARKRHF